ncbi:MAG: hypothetical protein CMH22_05620 [Methylophaga sp.]|nr:hypothetical protein [Methylophaga sp.]|tara:strand:+ start:105990 stop:106268 length:279 start_codon:yes stop_codon:yes gene_type:complete
MSKLEQKKIPIDIQTKQTLVRVNDGLKKTGVIKFIEFDDEGKGKKLHSQSKVGYACIVDPSVFYTWMTSVIVEVISDKHFKTQNSEYKIEEL